MTLIWFALLGHRDLFEPDEGRYAEIPREMVASGDWLTPRLNGFKYFEKPALQYWLTALSFKIWGQNNASARLWPALIGWICALFIAYLGHRLFGPPVGFYAFVLTLSHFLFVLMGHVLTLDMSVSAFIVMGLGALILAQTEPNKKLYWMLFGWAMLGFAVLSKGLIGLVLPGGAVLIYSLWQKDWRLWAQMHWLKGFSLFLLITAPWFIWVSIENKEFAHFFFIHEHFERYTSTAHHRDAPIYYFIPILLLGSAPWLIAFGRALLWPDFKKQSGFAPDKLLWVFVLFSLVFFSLGHSKLPAYILPVMPVLSLLAARQWVKQNTRAEGYSALLFAILLVLWALLGFNHDKIPSYLFDQYRIDLLFSAALIALGGFILLQTINPVHRIGWAGLFFLLALQSLLWRAQIFSSVQSSRLIAEAIRAEGLQDAPVFTVNHYPQSLPFYLGHPVRLALAKGELKMGIESEPEKWIADQTQLFNIWQAQKQAVAIFKNKEFAQYVQKGWPMQLILSTPRYQVVKK